MDITWSKMETTFSKIFLNEATDELQEFKGALE